MSDSRRPGPHPDRRRFLGLSVASVIGAGLGRALRPSRAAARTAPSRDAARVEPFSFCVVADSHCAEPATGRYKEGIEHLGNGVEKFLRCDREMAKLTGPDKPDFMIVAGDVHLWALRDRLHDVAVPMHGTNVFCA